MFYINYIKFKDSQQNKQVALLVSLTLVGILIYVAKDTLINFATGKSIQVYEYTYILILIYLLVNVYIAFNLEAEPGEQKSSGQVVEKPVVKEKVKQLEIVDDFIFPEKISYNFKGERKSLVPEFSDQGLIAPDTSEEEISFEPFSMMFPEDLVFDLPKISELEEEQPLSFEDLKMPEINLVEENKEDKLLSFEDLKMPELNVEEQNKVETSNEPLDEFEEVARKRRMFKDQLLKSNNQSDKMI